MRLTTQLSAGLLVFGMLVFTSCRQAVPMDTPSTMDEERFWQLIDEARDAAGADEEERASELTTRLEDLDPQEVVAFDTIYQRLHLQAYSWDLWGAAFVLRGGCGDDSFNDFRNWLLSEGRSVFEGALSDPESLAEIEIQGDATLEEFGYAAEEAYETLTGSPLPASGEPLPEQPQGEEWGEDEVENLYPRLSARQG